jgi:xylulokinase
MSWLGIDTGTGSTRALLVNSAGQQTAAFTAPHEEMRMERPTWAEQRPENWIEAAAVAIRGVLSASGLSGRDIKGLGLSGQMHGLVMLDRSGCVIRPALIWCDQRSQRQVDFINQTVGKEKILASIANPDADRLHASQANLGSRPRTAAL